MLHVCYMYVIYVNNIITYFIYYSAHSKKGVRGNFFKTACLKIDFNGIVALRLKLDGRPTK